MIDKNFVEKTIRPESWSKDISGCNHVNAKLSASQVIEIRNSNFTIKKLAEIYSMSRMGIQKVKSGKSYRRVK